MIAAWQQVWRNGIAPQLSVVALLALKHALETDDPRLLQGATVSPPPLEAVEDWPVEAACAIASTAWLTGGVTVGPVAQHFAEVCYRADRLLGEPSAIRHFLNWFDDTPRQEMRQLLLAEVNRTLADRIRSAG